MESQRNIPEIRFKGFDDNWGKKKLNEICTYHPSSLSIGDAKFDGKYPLYDANEIIGYTNSNVQENDYITIIKDGSGVGRVRLLQKNTSFIGTMGAFHSQDSDIQFLLCCLIKTNFRKHISGATIPHIYFSQYGEDYYLVPKLNEQTKIGNYFKELDNLIINSNLKIDKLKNIKKAMLDKMFPKDEANLPEIRFKGFDDAWVEDKLEELSEIYDGTHQTPKYTNNGIMFLSVENIKTLKSEKYISKKAFEEEFKVFPQKGDVLMTRIGDIGTANVVESNDPKAYYVSLALLKHKKLNPYFLKECISSETVVKDLWHRTLHIAFPKKINKNEIAKIVLPYPKSEKEQEKIGILFMQINNLVTLHQQKLEKLKNIKKAYFKKMFVQDQIIGVKK